MRADGYCTSDIRGEEDVKKLNLLLEERSKDRTGHPKMVSRPTSSRTAIPIELLPNLGGIKKCFNNFIPDIHSDLLINTYLLKNNVSP
jgi:hypothetical protein